MNLKGPISKTKSGLRSPIEAVSSERQSASAVETILLVLYYGRIVLFYHTDRHTLCLIDVRLFLIKGK